MIRFSRSFDRMKRLQRFHRELSFRISSFFLMGQRDCKLPTVFAVGLNCCVVVLCFGTVMMIT